MEENTQVSYAVICSGHVITEAERAGFHAYSTGLLTVVRIAAESPAEARKIATDHGWRVLAVGELKDAT